MYLKINRSVKKPRLLSWISWGKTVDATDKGTLILVKLPNLKVVRLKGAKIWLSKAAKIYRCLYCWGGGGGHNTLQTSVRFRDFEELYLC